MDAFVYLGNIRAVRSPFKFWQSKATSLVWSIPSVASKRVHVRKKHVWVQTWHVLPPNVRSLELLPTWFAFAQQNILCKNFRTLRIISGGKCAVSEREICLKVEKNEIWAKRADQKHINNLLRLGWQFALTAVKLFKKVWRENMSCLAPY